MVIFLSYVSLPQRTQTSVRSHGFFVFKTCEAFRAARETFGPVVAVWALSRADTRHSKGFVYMLYHCCRHCFKINGMVEGYIYIYIYLRAAAPAADPGRIGKV